MYCVFKKSVIIVISTTQLFLLSGRAREFNVLFNIPKCFLPPFYRNKITGGNSEIFIREEIPEK